MSILTYSLEHVRLVEPIPLFSVDSHTWTGGMHYILYSTRSAQKSRAETVTNVRITKTIMKKTKNKQTECNSAIQSPRESQFQHLTSSEIIKSVWTKMHRIRGRQSDRNDKMKEREYKCHNIVRIKTKHINNAWWKATYRAGRLLLLLLSWIHHYSFFFTFDHHHHIII